MIFSIEILIGGKEVFHENNLSPPDYSARWLAETITQIKHVQPLKNEYPKNYRCTKDHVMKKCFTKEFGNGPVNCDGC